MHNLVETILASFTREEIREFKYFLKGRENVAAEREDLRVIDRIRKGELPAPEKGGSNAYYQTKKRLKRQLELFLQLENAKYDRVSAMIANAEVGRYLFRKELYREGWHYLHLAERAADKAGEYELLEYIYYIQVSQTLSTWPLAQPQLHIPDLLARRRQNAKLAKGDADANSAYALLLYEIRELFSKEVFGNIDKLIQKILKQYDLENRIYDSPRIYATIVTMVCRVFREKKDYTGLKRYSIESFQVMKRKKMLGKVPGEFLMDLLRSVYQSSVRTGDYVTASAFREEYTREKQRFAGQHDLYTYYDFRARIMEADICMFTGRLEEAVAILSRLDEEYAAENRNQIIYFLLRINRIALHFKLGDYEACTKIYSGLIQQYGKQVLKEEGLGLEMLLYTEIYGAIFYFEKGEPEYVLYLLGRIKRKYASSATRNLLAREFLFIRILEKMVKQVSYISSERFKNDCTMFCELRKYVPGDKEYISLNAWLTSKVMGKSYYEIFLKLCRSTQGQKQLN